ncbi:hypothetical protein LguiB_001618 [Lonicera macranthoides]
MEKLNSACCFYGATVPGMWGLTLGCLFGAVALTSSEIPVGLLIRGCVLPLIQLLLPFSCVIGDLYTLICSGLSSCM